MNDNYYDSEEFKGYLSLYENSRKEGKPCILGSEDLTDIADYYDLKCMKEASLEVLRYALKLYPDAPSPLIYMAKIMACADKDPQKAREYLGRVTERNEDDPDYFSVYAEVCLLEDNKEEAVAWLERGDREVEEYEDKVDLYYDAAYMMLDYGFPEEAMRWADKIEEKDSDDFTKLRARFLVGEGKFEAAIPMIEAIIDKDPFYYEHWALLANIQLSCERYADALASSEYAIAIDSERCEAYMYQGNAYLKLGNYDKALEAFRRYTEGNGSDVGYMLQGRCLFYMQRNDEAMKFLKKAEALCPKDKFRRTDIYKDLAIAYVWLGDTANAAKYVRKIKELGTADSDLSIIEGGMMLNENRFEDATRVFLEGLPQDESQYEYMFRVGVAYYEHRYDEAAYKMLSEVKRLAPDRYYWASYLAACCFFMQKTDEFLENLEIAVTKTPEDARAVLAQLFPNDLEPYDYLTFARKRILGEK